MVEERKISQLPTRTDITGEEYMHIGFNGRSYKITVNSIIAKFNGGINLEVLQEIQDKLTELAQMGDLVTAEELTTAIAAIPAVDLSSFATSTAVADAIAQAIAAIPAVDLSGYATTQAVAVAIGEAAPDLSNLATKNEIPSLEGLARLSDIPAPAETPSETRVRPKRQSAGTGRPGRGPSMRNAAPDPSNGFSGIPEPRRIHT